MFANVYVCIHVCLRTVYVCVNVCRVDETYVYVCIHVCLRTMYVCINVCRDDETHTSVSCCIPIMYVCDISYIYKSSGHHLQIYTAMCPM